LETVPVLSGVWLTLFGCGISFMIQPGKYANLENVTIYVLFLGLFPESLLALLNKKIALVLMLFGVISGLVIIYSTDCFGWHDKCAPFTAPYFMINYLIAASCVAAADLLSRKPVSRQSVEEQ
jgi:hypothetical protein